MALFGPYYIPGPVVIPNPIPVPRRTDPGTVVTTPPGGTTTGTITTFPIATSGGSITDAFAAPFDFPLDWKLIGAILLLILTINAMETWYPEYVWYYVAILLLGAVITKRFGGFGNALRSLTASGTPSGGNVQ